MLFLEDHMDKKIFGNKEFKEKNKWHTSFSRLCSTTILQILSSQKVEMCLEVT